MDNSKDIKNVYSFFNLNYDQNMMKWYEKKYYNNMGYDNGVLKTFSDKGGAIWLSAEGNIYYKLSLNGNIHTAPIRKINLVLSNFLKRNVKIVYIMPRIKLSKTKAEDIDITRVVNLIHINDLLLIEGETFNPTENKEFFLINDLWYRNTFKPTYFLSLFFKKNDDLTSIFSDSIFCYKDSIIVQYLYYLSNYNKDKFLYLINWIAVFFQKLSDRRDTLLVFLGNKNSGKDIFFEEIIKPLFGKEYCLNITDDIFESKYLKKKLMNKLFYNFKNISDIKNKKKNNLLKRLIYSSSFDIEDSEIKFYGQKIITIDEPYLPYIDDDYKDYVVFKVPENINAMYIPPNFLKKISNLEEFNKAKLIEHIKQDLVNFTFILRNHKVDFEILKNNINYDDKKYINHTLEDKVRAFVNAIKSGDISYFKSIEKINPELFEEIEKDYENQKIKQKNLMKCFSALNTSDDISGSRKLMKELRKNDKEYFAESKIISGSGGVKYYKFSKKNLPII